jgi:hypothetical protein
MDASSVDLDAIARREKGRLKRLRKKILRGELSALPQGFSAHDALRVGGAAVSRPCRCSGSLPLPPPPPPPPPTVSHALRTSCIFAMHFIVILPLRLCLSFPRSYLYSLLRCRVAWLTLLLRVASPRRMLRACRPLRRSRFSRRFEPTGRRSRVCPWMYDDRCAACHNALSRPCTCACRAHAEAPPADSLARRQRARAAGLGRHAEPRVGALRGRHPRPKLWTRPRRCASGEGVCTDARCVRRPLALLCQCHPRVLFVLSRHVVSCRVLVTSWPPCASLSQVHCPTSK